MSLLLSGFIVAFYACSPLDTRHSKVVYTNFKEEVDIKQNLVFLFDKDMAKATHIGVWTDKPLMNIEPAVAGNFKWKTAKELVFSPEKGFMPSTDYTVTFSEEFFEGLEEKVSLKDNSQSFEFHTPYLALNAVDAFWGMSVEGEPQIRMNMNFNYPVSPKQVGEALNVKANDSDIAFKVNTSSEGKVIQVSLSDSKKIIAKTLKLEIGKGLGLKGSDYKADEMLFETEVPSREKFKVLSAEADVSDNNYAIKVHTNQAVGVTDIRPYVTVSIGAQAVRHSSSSRLSYEVEKMDYGFLVKGNFQHGITYKLVVDDLLKGVFQDKLSSDFEQDIMFGKLSPSISFTDKKSIYLNKQGAQQLGVKVVSVPEVEVSIYKVYRNNILAFLRESGQLYSTDNFYYTDNSKYGDLIFTQTMKTSSLKKANGHYLIDLDVPDETRFEGIYMVYVKSTDERYVNAKKILAMSDIGMIAKKGKKHLTVFANSIATSEPIQGVQMRLVSYNNQEVYEAVTDANGVASFPDLKDNAPNFNVQMVTASKGDDFNYLHFRQTAVEQSRYEVGGIRENSAGLQAFLYGDRNLYRPGETVYVKTIVRNQKWGVAGELPVKVKMLLPDGNEFVSERAALNAEGTYETSFKLPQATVTGGYNIELYTANDILLATHKVNVEEFVPDRIKVNVNMDKKTVSSGEDFVVKAQALNLFGPPAVGRKYESELALYKKHFAPKEFGEYSFYLEGMDNVSFERDYREGETGEEGELAEQFNISKEYKHKGILEGRVYTTVFDETGRPVSRLKKFDILTQDVFLGVKGVDRYIKSGTEMSVPLVAVNHDGKVYKSAKAKVKLIKHEWQSVLEKNYYGEYRYVSHRKEKLKGEKEVILSGKSSAYTFVPQESGSYEIRVSLPDADTYVSRSFYAYRWGSTTSSSFEVDKEGRVAIEFDKNKYEVGEEANLLLKAPFAGKMLVTVERGEVLDYYTLDTDKKVASLSIPIKEEYLPNAYISATLIKPLQGSAIPLTVAHGFESMTVAKKENKMDLVIEAPEKSRSRRKQTIKIKSSLEEEDIELTVAVVDEGILQVKNYKSPDPYKFFFQKKALEVRSYDLYPQLLPELKPQANSFGAGVYGLAKRVNPLGNKRVKLVSYWSGTLKTDSDGEASYDIEIPEYSGDLRIMAVGVKGSVFGMGSTNMKVADPLVVSTALPRFMSPSDEVDVPVTLSNTTDKPMTVKADLKVSGKVLLDGEGQKELTIPAKGEKVANFHVKADNAIGTAKITLVAKANGESFTNTTDMTVRPAISLLKSSGAGKVSSKGSVDLDLKKGYLTSSISGKLLVSKSPVVQFADNLDYLLRYPHGCVEQTTSAVFPQLYFADLSNALGGKGESSKALADSHISDAIKKLYTMQMYNGGLSYWQGGSYESWWGSVYACHFLQEADRAGYHVEKRFMKKLYGYLKGQLKRKRTRNYYYYENGTTVRRELAPKEIFYSMYVLAGTGYKDISTMNYYKSKPELLATDSKYLLACTYMMLGDMQSYRQLIPSGFGDEKAKKELSGSFSSYIRDKALVMNVLLESDDKNAQIGTLARQLSKSMKEEKYLSTQERSFAMLALGKFTKKANSQDIQADIKVGGKVLTSYDNKDLVLTSQVLGKQVIIDSKSKGDLFYFWEIEGLNETGEYVEEDKDLKVRKTFYDREGNQLGEESSIKQNDLIIVKVTLSSFDSKVENVVVTDILPACFEIENPRISQIAGVDWAKGSSPEHTDFRDDRVNFFTTATPKAKDFYYMVRVVSKGAFRMGPVSADAMYDGAYHSYHGAADIVVK